MQRYARQLLYKHIGKQGQKKVMKSSAAIVGVGALGTVCAELLCRAGIGKLTLIDRDFIEDNNLQRQSLFTQKDIGREKALCAKNHLEKINTDTKIKALVADVDHTTIQKTIGQTDLILGCTDTMESRFLLNDYALANSIPYVYGGAVGDKGAVMNIVKNGPCLQCVIKGSTHETCDTVGVLNTNTHIIASFMANESLKILLGINYEKDMLHFDIWNNSFLKIKVKKDTTCPACKGIYEYLSGEKGSSLIKLCGKGMYQIKGKKLDLDAYAQQLKKLGNVNKLTALLHFNNLTLFADGRVFVKAKNQKEAQKMYDTYIGN